MKQWRKKFEWVSYSNCGGDVRYTAEYLNDQDVREVAEKCGVCPVRPECIQWAIDEEVSSVVVAGIPLPDPAFKKKLQRIYSHFRDILPAEFEARGEDF